MAASGGIDALKRSAKAAEKEENTYQDRETERQRRFSIQQMLNQVGPIFKAHASGGTPAIALVEGTTLADHVETSLRLAIHVASLITNTAPESVDPAFVRAIRPAMADIVAERTKANIPVDIAKDGAAVAGATRAVDPKFDINPFARNPISHDDTMKMTACAGIASIYREMTLYNFRTQNFEQAVARILNAVIEKTAAIVLDVAGSDATQDTRTALMQSFVRHHADIMANALGRKTAETLQTLRPMTEAQRAEWYSKNDPIGDAIARFNDIVGGMGAAIVVWERHMKGLAVGPGGSSMSA